MARTSIRVGLLPSTRFMLGALPVPKYTDLESGIFATDRETGAKLYTVMIFLMEDDRAETLKVTVPETGLPNGLKPGMPVKTIDLVANPWANMFNGQVSSGVTYRVTALTAASESAAADTAGKPETAK
ncbi:hypothetical protein Stsp01_40140 [Streptomyces sp. NBRC 13847]|uniref:SCO3933 family regulatory protein n=1 Tax=Streptomyces TaxID=1883 RepID=UPI0024A5DB87|nr:hypothetical protein [Streptomyces sp. NBRC 13847]GLW17271.1 hypothetical protein Stsp01_40140 [Streptomyces sp. NBRC 13847]